MADKIFAKGIYFNEKSGNAPDFVLGSLSIKTGEFIEFLKEQGKGDLKLKILMSKGGKPYLEVDTWKPDGRKSNSVVFTEPKDTTGSDLPF